MESRVKDLECTMCRLVLLGFGGLMCKNPWVQGVGVRKPLAAVSFFGLQNVDSSSSFWKFIELFFQI